MELGMEFCKIKYLRPKLVFPPILVLNWVSFTPLSFFLSASTAATYIFTYLYSYYNYSRTLCGVQHFILRYNKVSLLCIYHWKRWQGVKAEGMGGEREGDLTDNYIVSSLFPYFENADTFGFYPTLSNLVVISSNTHPQNKTSLNYPHRS